MLSNVQGIDIHPVAVTIARATYVLASWESSVNTARKPIQIPIFMADSLFLPREVEANLLDSLSGVEIVQYGERKHPKHMIIPGALIQSPELFWTMLSQLARASPRNTRRTGKDTRTTMEKASLPGRCLTCLKLLEYERILDALWDIHGEGVGPYLLRQKKDLNLVVHHSEQAIAQRCSRSSSTSSSAIPRGCLTVSLQTRTTNRK